MKKIFSVVFSLFLVVSVLVSPLLMTAEAAFSVEIDDGGYINAQLASDSQLLGGTISNYSELKSFLSEKFRNFETEINISSFRVSVDNASLLSSCIFYDIPEAFNIDNYSYYRNTTTGLITRLIMKYNMDEADYKAQLAVCESTAETFISDLKYSSLSDVYKALLVHDRLIEWCEYDYQNYLTDTIPESSYNMNGVFVNATAVCSGYSRAYKYMLEKLGLTCFLCDSDILCHEWNIVEIDGVKYHVDTSWDDPVWDVFGKVSHENFLRSTDGIISTDHTANDFDTSPVSTTYDSYYWQNSETEFQYKNGVIYYYDTVNKILNKIENGSTVTLKTISDRWSVSGGYYSKSYVKLDSDNYGNYLFYSTTSAVYKYDLDTNTASVFYTPELPANYYWIYGFKAQNDYFYLNINNSPNLNSEAYAKNIIYRYYTEPIYTVSFYSIQSSEPQITEIQYGELFGELPTPQTRTGWIFDGWFTAADGGEQITPATQMLVRDNIDIYAHWHHDSFILSSSAPYSFNTEKKLIYGGGILSADSASFASCFENTNISVDFNGLDRAATGTKIQLTDDTGEAYDTAYAVVVGDVNGDGWYDGTDSIIVNCLVNGILSETQVGDAVYFAADCDANGTVDENDVMILEQAGLLLCGVDQSKTPSEFTEDSVFAEYISLIKTNAPIAAAEETESITAEFITQAPVGQNTYRQIVDFVLSFFRTLIFKIINIFE